MGPKPIDSTSIQKEGCSETISSNCVIWDEDVPCLGLCKGMKLTEAMYREAKLTCELLSQLTGVVGSNQPIDFSKLNFGCAWSPTITGWSCPQGQVFVQTGIGSPPGWCGILGPTGSGVYYPGVGWVIASTNAVPVFTSTPNPVPRPTTLTEILQLIIDHVPCCNPC